jgi:hypothetical protein
LLGPGHLLIKKKNLPGRGLTKVEKHWSRVQPDNFQLVLVVWTVHRLSTWSASYSRCSRRGIGDGVLECGTRSYEPVPKVRPSVARGGEAEIGVEWQEGVGGFDIICCDLKTSLQ